MQQTPKLIFSDGCLDYRSPGHPEKPERVLNVFRFLKEKGFKFESPQPAREEDILLAHSQGLLSSVAGGNFFEPDTPFFNNIYEIALLSCGGAILSAQFAKKSLNAFSLMRPPGHHATREKLMGFCYFNNIAVATLKVFKTEKVAIIDFDCHHGNGTEDILKGKENCLYVSLHQSPCYPGTGLASSGNSKNFPLPAGTNGEKYIEVFRESIKEVEKFKPDFVGVSAGFDTFKNDPLTDMCLDIADYEKIGKLIKDLGKPVFCVLEGGYSDELPQLIFSFLKGLSE